MALKETDTYTSGHVYLWRDEKGDTVDASVFCSDFCHREFLRMRGISYEGWHGCVELPAPSWCHNCGKEF